LSYRRLPAFSQAGGHTLAIADWTGGEDIKTVIYLDVLLLVNFLMSYFLLLAAGVMAGGRARFARMVAGSVLAALSALILLAPELPYPVQLAYKVVTAALIVAAAYGVRPFRRYLTAVVWYAVLNLLLAALVLLAILRTATPLLHTGNLAVYLRVPPLLLLGLSALCCLGTEIASRCLHRPPHVPGIVGIQLELCGITLRLRAALDTGCHLKDPMTCLPVLLVSYPDARARLPAPVCEFLDGWFAGEGEPQPPEKTRLRLIPCATASQHTLLPGFAVQEIGLITPQNGIKGLERTAIAFSPLSFGSDEYEALYGTEFLS